MEKISEFFKELKERLSSPLFSSFILTWLIFNWRIITGILFYKNTELHLDGYNSYIDLIQKNSSTSNFLWKPLASALVYTFVFPFIRNIILAFNAWIKSWGNTWNLNISKSGKVSVLKYIELRNTYKERTDLLEQVLVKESEYLSNIEELKNENLQQQNKINNLELKVSKWTSYNNIEQLNGEWEYIVKDPKSESEKVIRKIFISNGTFRVTNENNEDENFRIKFFIGSPDSNRVFCLIAPQAVTSKSQQRYFILKIDNSFNQLVGEDNFNENIVLKRIR